MNFDGSHAGIHYSKFISELCLKRQVQRYLEIGVHEGHNLSQIRCETALGVDPNFRLRFNIAEGKRRLVLCQMPSDTFFATEDVPSRADGPIDLSFLDGFHTFEYLLRDFYNAERVSHRGSLIIMHDCIPLNFEMTERKHEPSRRKDTALAAAWTGDVWKVVPILKRFRPDLRIVLLDCPPTGLVCVSNLDPGSTVLRDQYLEIVSAFRELDDEEQALEDFLRSIALTESAAVLNELDHSLYFAL